MNRTPLPPMSNIATAAAMADTMSGIARQNGGAFPSPQPDRNQPATQPSAVQPRNAFDVIFAELAALRERVADLEAAAAPQGEANG
jgi:hypothetical protein